MKTLLSILFLFFSLSAFSQNSSQYDNIPLATADECRRAEPQVSLAADYVYTTSIDKEDLNRKNAISFIMKWMSGTSDYSFIMEKSTRKIIGTDRELVGIYAACMAKYALEKGRDLDREALKYNSYLLLALYCENPDNNFKPSGEIKKLIDAKNQNKLKEYLAAKQK
ncbi:MAG: hypothetical protein WC780_15290 [Lentimicrobiaceae bacterium]|jgi:hypothetical protein